MQSQFFMFGRLSSPITQNLFCPERSIQIGLFLLRKKRNIETIMTGEVHNSTPIYFQVGMHTSVMLQ